MGARLPPNDRPRRGGIKCEFCGRAVHSVEALRSHQNALHSQALKEKLKSALKNAKLSKTIEVKTVKKEATKVEKESPATDRKTRMEKNKSVTETQTSKSVNKTGQRKTEFQCPVCGKSFPVLFSAQKHIQKYHNVTQAGKNASSTKVVIRPITVDLCVYCNEKFPSPHDCPNRPEPGFGLKYECVGCQQRFSSLKLFDIHVGDVHGDGLESMFFPSNEEFNTWKDQMQSQTDCSYTLMGQYNSRKVYRCSNLSDYSDNDEAQFCPSTIICLSYPRGFQVYFYPKHYEHEHEEYNLTDQYKTYSITDLILQAGGKFSNDKDLYIEFKTLMETIVLDAAKLNIDTLKILMEKATDMTSVLTQYDEEGEDAETPVHVTNLIVAPQKKESTIKTLQGESRKREIGENGLSSIATVAKRPRQDNLKKFSLADEKDSDKILKELDTAGNKTKSNLKSKDSGDEIEKTKLTMEKKFTQSPSFNDSYKEFVMTTVSKKAVPPKKKIVVKTKMGQFKPSLSPKKRSSLRKSEIQYEVKERENDCNILILKI